MGFENRASRQPTVAGYRAGSGVRRYPSLRTLWMNPGWCGSGSSFFRKRAIAWSVLWC